MENLEREQKIRAFIEGLIPEINNGRSQLIFPDDSWNACRAEILEALKKADFELLLREIQ